MLYNKDTKLAYIAETSDGKDEETYERAMKACFNNTAEKEFERKKDICEFTNAEIKDYYSSLKTASVMRLTVVDSQLKRYAAWTVDKGIINSEDNKFKEIKNDDLIACVDYKDTIISRENLIKEISILPNVGERFLCLALFEGISGKEYCELVNLKKEDFERKDGKWIVHLGTRDLEVSEELVDLGIESADTSEMYLYTRDLSFVKSYYMNDGEEKSRVIKNPPQSYGSSSRAAGIRVKNKLDRIGSYLGNPAITRSNLLESGKINMVKRFYQNDGIQDIRQILINHNTEITERYGYIQNKQRWVEMYGKYVEG